MLLPSLVLSGIRKKLDIVFYSFCDFSHWRCGGIHCSSSPEPKMSKVLRGIFSLQDERLSRKYAPKETIAPPKHMPVPIRCTTSTARMFAKAERFSMAKKLMTPKAVSMKKMRRNLRRSFIDCPLNCLSD